MCQLYQLLPSLAPGGLRVCGQFGFADAQYLALCLVEQGGGVAAAQHAEGFVVLPCGNAEVVYQRVSVAGAFHFTLRETPHKFFACRQRDFDAEELLIEQGVGTICHGDGDVVGRVIAYGGEGAHVVFGQGEAVGAFFCRLGQGDVVLQLPIEGHADGELVVLEVELSLLAALQSGQLALQQLHALVYVFERIRGGPLVFALKIRVVAALAFAEREVEGDLAALGLQFAYFVFFGDALPRQVQLHIFAVLGGLFFVDDGDGVSFFKASAFRG